MPLIDLLVPALALLAAGDSLPRPSAAPPTTVEPAAVVVHRQPAVPLVALRLSILADDPAGYAGAGHLLQHLVHPALREQAALVGGRVQLQRTSDAVVFSVVGPAAELDYLAGILRGALRAPQVNEAEMLLASRELAEERLAEWETADRHVRSALRTRLFPRDLSAAGTEASANRLMESGALRRAWARLYDPRRVSVVAVGDADLAAVRRVFSDLPPPPPNDAVDVAADTLDPEPLASAEATQGWLAIGYAAPDADPAALSVAARVIGTQLAARLPGSSVRSEHWWTHHGQALAVVVSAPAARLDAARRDLGTAIARAESSLTPGGVSTAARALRREMLFYARTPERMAEVLGQFADRGGDAEAAQEFYATLDRVDVDEVRAVLERLGETTPIRAELPPGTTLRR